MENENLSIKERVKKIITNKNISTLSDEKEIIETLLKLSDDDINQEYNNKTVESIENYLTIKEKMQTAKEDFEFLTKMASALRKQEIRKTDISRPPLFKIKNSIGEDIYFLTREALEEYEKCNKNLSNDVIMIPHNNNTELTKLLEIIKRNF